MTQIDFLPERTGVCTHCGRPIQQKTFTCPECGLFQPQMPLPANLPEPFQARQVSTKALSRSGIPIIEKTYLALGGGLGSFAWADYLRVCGASSKQIAVIGTESIPYARFRRLCLTSQISDSERLRSESAARPDNLWGWPGYALEEIADLVRQKQLRKAAEIAWQIFGEPTMAYTYTPTAERVYKSIDEEMKRIEWQWMLHVGQICAVRQTDDGRYAVLYLPTVGRRRTPRFVVAPYLHLALGYPGIRLTPEAKAYRDTYHDFQRVVQAYEDHEHIYRRLGQEGGIVVLRGRGVAASRILQRLDEIRQQTGQSIQVVHLMRSPATEQTTYQHARRPLQLHRQIQPFNWPKATFGGELRIVMEKATPQERKALAAIWGNTTTTDRPDWQEVAERAHKEGWYTIVFGNITEIRPNGRDHLIIKTRDYDSPRTGRRLVADYLFDCTGLVTAPTSHPILADLTCRYDLEQNPAGGWLVSPDFEVKGLRNGCGQVFAAGITAAGNAFAPVDSFLGLQYAAQRSINVLIQEKAPNLRPLNGRESLRQWWRWAKGINPSKA
ncbi:MAG: hypothetical protein WAM60_07160 [Candidatus Promineifilaceae bacterium]